MGTLPRPRFFMISEGTPNRPPKLTFLFGFATACCDYFLTICWGDSRSLSDELSSSGILLWEAATVVAIFFAKDFRPSMLLARFYGDSTRSLPFPLYRSGDI